MFRRVMAVCPPPECGAFWIQTHPSLLIDMGCVFLAKLTTVV
jgi:hypothetical protein